MVAPSFSPIFLFIPTKGMFWNCIQNGSNVKSMFVGFMLPTHSCKHRRFLSKDHKRPNITLCFSSGPWNSTKNLFFPTSLKDIDPSALHILEMVALKAPLLITFFETTCATRHFLLLSSEIYISSDDSLTDCCSSSVRRRPSYMLASSTSILD